MEGLHVAGSGFSTWCWEGKLILYLFAPVSISLFAISLLLFCIVLLSVSRYHLDVFFFGALLTFIPKYAYSN